MAAISVTWYTWDGDLQPTCQLRCVTYWQANLPIPVCSYNWRHYWTVTAYCVAKLYIVFVTYCLWFRNFTCRCLCSNWTLVSCLQSDNHRVDLLNWQLCPTKTTFSWEIYWCFSMPIKKVHLLFSSAQLFENRNWHELHTKTQSVPRSKHTPSWL